MDVSGVAATTKLGPHGTSSLHIPNIVRLGCLWFEVIAPIEPGVFHETDVH